MTTQQTQQAAMVFLHSPILTSEHSEPDATCQESANRDSRMLTQGDTLGCSVGDTHNILKETSSDTSVRVSPDSDVIDIDQQIRTAFKKLGENQEGRAILAEVLDKTDIRKDDIELWLSYKNCKAFMRGKTLTLAFIDKHYLEWVKEWYLDDMQDAIQEHWGVRYRVVATLPEVEVSSDA